MKRRLFNLLAAASLVLCVATVALWFTNLSRTLVLVIQQPQDWETFSGSEIDAIGGLVVVSLPHRFMREDCHPQIVAVPRSLADGWYQAMNTQCSESVRQRFLWHLGFSYTVDIGRPEDRADVLVVPKWLLMAVTAVLPWRWFRDSRLRRALRLAGFCRKCGYDLRATPDRCPECGTAVGPAA